MKEIKSVTIAVPVTELESAKLWYTKLLGDIEQVEPAPGVWEFSLTPTCWLQLFEVDSQKPNQAIIRFESSDINASHELASQLAADVMQIESVPGMVHYFDFSDPFGNPLSFYELLGDAA